MTLLQLSGVLNSRLVVNPEIIPPSGRLGTNQASAGAQISAGFPVGRCCGNSVPLLKWRFESDAGIWVPKNPQMEFELRVKHGLPVDAILGEATVRQTLYVRKGYPQK